MRSSFFTKNRTKYSMKIESFKLHCHILCAIIALRNTQYMAILHCEKGEKLYGRSQDNQAI